MINVAIFIGRVVAWHYIIRGSLTLGRRIGEYARAEAEAEARAKAAAQA